MSGIFLLPFALGAGGLFLSKKLHDAHTEYNQRCTEEATATIVSWRKETDDDGTTYYPTVRYSFRDQEYTKEFIGAAATRYTIKQVGDTIPIMLNPEKPLEITNPNDSEDLLLPVISIVLFILGIVILSLDIKAYFLLSH